MQLGMVKVTFPLLAINLSTPHLPSEVRPSSQTLNHCSPVTLDCVAEGTLALCECEYLSVAISGSIGYLQVCHDWPLV